MTTSRRALSAVLLLSAAAAHALLLYDYPFEDAFISFRYVENLLAGHGFAYNPGQRVEGFTSFGWVVLLAGAKQLGLPLVTTARALSLAFALLLVALTARIAAVVQPGRAPWWLASGALVAAHGTWAYYARTGMETPLFALLVLWAAWVLAAPGRGRALLAAGILAAAALVRPEGIGYAAALATMLALRADARRDAGVLAGVFALLFVPYFVWRWQHFGWPLPNTYYAKASPSRALMVDGLRQLEEFVTLGAFALALLGLLVVLWQRWSARWWRLSAGVMLGAMVNVVLVGGDSFAFHRFFLPAIPFAAITTVEGVRVVGQRLRLRGRRSGVAGAVLTALLAAWLFASAFVPRRSLSGDHGISQYRRVRGVARINEDYFVVGRWLREHFAPDTVIALNAAGIVPYESGLATIDMLGLNDVHIAHRPIALGDSGAAGHEKHDAGYVLGRRPDLIVPGLPVLGREKIRPGRLMPWFQRWFRYLPGDRELFRHPALARDYVAVSVPVAEDGFFTFFLRKDAPRPKRR